MNKIEFYSNLANFQGRNGDAFLKHYGILGQKWGTRRWQNPDGTFNTEGKIRYFGNKKAQNETSEEKVTGLFDKVKKKDKEYLSKHLSKEHYNFLINMKDPVTGKLKNDLKLVENNLDTFHKMAKYYAHGETEKAIMYGKEHITDDKERGALQSIAYKVGIEDGKTIRNDLDKTKELINNIKTDKELSGNKITEKEFERIINDAIDVRDIGINDDGTKEDWENVANIGIYKLNENGYDTEYKDPGDVYAQSWFMNNDAPHDRENYSKEIIGYPELTYLYYKGYSKDYIKQFLEKIPEKQKEFEQIIKDEDPVASEYTGWEDVFGYERPIYQLRYLVDKDKGLKNTNDFLDILYADRDQTLKKASDEYGYKIEIDNYGNKTLDKDFNTKENGKLKIKMNTEDYETGNDNAKGMRNRMKNDQKFIDNFEKINVQLYNKVADYYYDQYCDDMEYYDKKPMSYTKFLNYIKPDKNIDSYYGGNDTNRYYMIYNINVPGYESALQVDFSLNNNNDTQYVDTTFID